MPACVDEPAATGQIAVALTATGADGATYRFAPGTRLYLFSDFYSQVVELERDESQVTVDAAPGARVVLRRMGPGEVFGETAILAQQPRSASVEAVDEITTIVVTREALESELCKGSWAGAFVRALAQRSATSMRG